MSNKQDRKLLAQLAAGYMASITYPEDLKDRDYAIAVSIKDSVKYAVGALAAIDAHLEARRAAEVRSVLDSVPSWAQWRTENRVERLIDTRSGRVIGRIQDTLWHAAKYPGDIHEAYGSERGDLAKAEIIRAVQWEKWEAHGAKVLAARVVPFALPAWAEWRGTTLIAKHLHPTIECRMAEIGLHGWTAWLRPEMRKGETNHVSGPETGDMAKVKIYEVLDWESYAPAPAEPARDWRDRGGEFLLVAETAKPPR